MFHFIFLLALLSLVSTTAQTLYSHSTAPMFHSLSSIGHQAHSQKYSRTPDTSTCRLIPLAVQERCCHVPQILMSRFRRSRGWNLLVVTPRKVSLWGAWFQLVNLIGFSGICQHLSQTIYRTCRVSPYHLTFFLIYIYTYAIFVSHAH